MITGSSKQSKEWNRLYWNSINNFVETFLTDFFVWVVNKRRLIETSVGGGRLSLKTIEIIIFFKRNINMFCKNFFSNFDAASCFFSCKRTDYFIRYITSCGFGIFFPVCSFYVFVHPFQFRWHIWHLTEWNLFTQLDFIQILSATICLRLIITGKWFWSTYSTFWPFTALKSHQDVICE